MLHDTVRGRLLARHHFGFVQRQGARLLAQQAERLVPHDPAQPAGERGGLGEARQPRPCGDERFLNHVLGLLEVAHQRQRRAVGGVLEAPRQLHEGFHIAAAGFPYE